MALPNIFTRSVADTVIARINALTPQAQPTWGTMNVSQMLAHCSVTYEMVYEENKHPKPSGVLKFFLKTFVKGAVVGEKPFKHNSRTAPQFLITDKREFDTERQRLIDYINKTEQTGIAHFDGKESHSFGKLSKQEWNNMFYKHLDHHLTQFGV